MRIKITQYSEGIYGIFKPGKTAVVSDTLGKKLIKEGKAIYLEGGRPNDIAEFLKEEEE